jgi:hypothetical protein
MNSIRALGPAVFLLLALSSSPADAVTTTTNVAPVISGSPATTVVAGTRYQFRPTASDANGDRIRFRISGKPSWGTFSRYTGEFTGIPPAGLNATFSNIVVSASDGSLTSSLPAFSIRVTSGVTNVAPTISGSPPTSVLASAAYSFRPAASDANGDPLTFSIQNKPAWAVFSASTGQLSGTAPSVAGTSTGIVISVSDGKLSVALPAFAINVTAPVSNAAPTISGVPATSVQTAAAYSFRPTATDANGDALSFSIQSKPSWASFSVATGQLSGTAPAAATTNPGIVISVSDGQVATALPAFTINVTAPTSGTASLSWSPPTQNTDGSALTDLSGYRLYFGSSPSSLTQVLAIAGAATTAHVVTNLSAGTWYFALTARTSAGVESAMSTLVSKAIP